ncbi:MAG: tail fiber protein [Candidatus Sulfotelmatobacter sp.]
MSDQYVGEIRMFGGNFAINGWAFCNGALISVSQNETLFSVLGTTYGGDGVNNFSLPDLQCRVPVCQGQGSGLQNYTLGQKGGVETVTLVTGNLPSHSHPAMGSAATVNSGNPAGNTWGVNTLQSFGKNTNATMNSASVSYIGGGQPHENMPNFLALSFIIALYGIYPSQS